MPRVLHVISGLAMGGAERVLLDVAHGLKQRGLPQHVVSVGDRGVLSDRLEAEGIPVETLGVSSIFSAAIAVQKLKRIIARVNPDIVQGWLPQGNLVAALAHRMEKGRGRRRLMWGLHATNVKGWGPRMMIALTKLVSSWPDAIIAASEAAANYHLQHGYRPRRVEIIYNGIDTDKFRPNPAARAAFRREWKISEDESVAIHVARVHPMKNHAIFLEALKSLPQIRGLLVGPGTETLSLSLSLPANALALGLRFDVEALFASADIVVSTSSFAEAFGIVVAEGMSAGCLPIATDIGAFRMVLGDAGQIIPPDDKDALVSALSRYATLSADELADGRARARERIVNCFSLTKMIDRYAAVYAQ